MCSGGGSRTAQLHNAPLAARSLSATDGGVARGAQQRSGQRHQVPRRAMLRRHHTSVYPYVKPICGYEDLVSVVLLSVVPAEERPFRSGPQATSDPPFFAPCLEGFFA